MRTAAFFFLLFALSFAHLDEGIDKRVGEYIVDIGFTKKVAEEEEAVSFAINLVNASTKEPQNYSLFVRILKDEKIIFASTLMPNKGSAVFSFTPLEAGNYSFEFTFKPQNISESVSIEVRSKAEEKEHDALFLVVASFLAGFAASKLLSRIKE